MTSGPNQSTDAPFAERVRAVWANPQARYPVLVVTYLALIGLAFDAVLPNRIWYSLR